ncbi:MAG: hypothetical protein EOP04_21110 [Proteobacteria bacterium]|nr:MAG: hypothetical protein EOP04_21110 [Pseudomonadota bacterium]
MTAVIAKYWQLLNQYGSKWQYAAKLYYDIRLREEEGKIDDSHSVMADLCIDIVEMAIWDNRALARFFFRVFAEAYMSKPENETEAMAFFQTYGFTYSKELGLTYPDIPTAKAVLQCPIDSSIVYRILNGSYKAPTFDGNLSHLSDLDALDKKRSEKTSRSTSECLKDEIVAEESVSSEAEVSQQVDSDQGLGATEEVSAVSRSRTKPKTHTKVREDENRRGGGKKK